MKLEIMKGKASRYGAAYEKVLGEKTFFGEGEDLEVFEAEDPTIYIGEGLLEGKSDIPVEVGLAHEIYHMGRSPRRGIRATELSDEDFVSDEIEAVMFAAQSTGIPASKEGIEAVKDLGTKVFGLSGRNFQRLVEAAAHRLGYEKSLRSWR